MRSRGTVRRARTVRGACVAAAVGAAALGAGAARAQGAAPGDSAAPAPLTLTRTYTGEVVGVGGGRRGAVYVGTAGVQLGIVPPLARWRGLSAMVFVLDTHGGSPSGLAGDLQGVSNLQAPPRLRLEEAWVQQNLAGNRVSVLAGKYDLSTEFDRLQSAGLFVNGAFGTTPELAQSGAGGPSVYPNTTFGVRIAVKPSPGSVARVAVTHPPAGSGAMIVGEAAFLARPDTGAGPRHPRFQIGRGLGRTYAGKVAAGGWYQTARFPDASGSGAPHRGSRGAYLVADQTLWKAAGAGTSSLSAFAQLGVGDSRVQTIAGYAGGGFTLTGPLARRPNDEVGIAVAHAWTGAAARRADPSLGGAETALELTGSVAAASWLTLQPDLQYVLRPGAVRGAAAVWVPALRFSLAR